MKKRFYLNISLFQLLNVTIKPAVDNMQRVLIKAFQEFRGAVFSSGMQTSFTGARSTAPVPLFYKIFNPLTAAWFT